MKIKFILLIAPMENSYYTVMKKITTTMKKGDICLYLFDGISNNKGLLSTNAEVVMQGH